MLFFCFDSSGFVRFLSFLSPNRIFTIFHNDLIEKILQKCYWQIYGTNEWTCRRLWIYPCENLFVCCENLFLFPFLFFFLFTGIKWEYIDNFLLLLATFMRIWFILPFEPDSFSHTHLSFSYSMINKFISLSYSHKGINGIHVQTENSAIEIDKIQRETEKKKIGEKLSKMPIAKLRNM